jgi:FtsH-binding integral membrane protein
MEFSFLVFSIFSFRKPQSPFVTFVSSDAVAVTLNISIKVINLFHTICDFLMSVSEGRPIVRSTESYFNRTAHISFI